MPTRSLAILLSIIAWVSSTNAAGNNDAQSSATASVTRTVGTDYQMQIRPRKRSIGTLPTSIWELDINTSGNFCFAENRPIQLWRPNANQGFKLNISKVGQQSSVVPVRWEAGKLTMNWPARLKPKANDRYLLTSIGQGSTDTVVRMHHMPADIRDAGTQKQIAWLNANGCDIQSEVLKTTSADSAR